MSASRREFLRLGAESWRNLGLTALAIGYALFTVGSLAGRGLFETVGGDYRSYYASAEIAVQEGFAQVYSLPTQARFQEPLYAAYARFPELYATVPTPYLPVFILLFLPLLLVPPVAGFILWTLLNGVALILYLWRFKRALGGYPERGFLAVVLLSWPVFLNMLFGQVNVLLLIALGEFLLATAVGGDIWPGKDFRPERGRPFPSAAPGGRAAILRQIWAAVRSFASHREFRGGVWLGLGLLKPQALLLLIPGLLIGRRFRALAGFAAIGLVLLGFSLLLAGPAGLFSLAELLFRYSEGLPTNVPQHMMNWRAVAINLIALLRPLPAWSLRLGGMAVGSGEVAWGLAVVGMALTAGAGLAFWFRPADPASPRFVLALLGTYAATCAATWHSHVQMSLPLVALFLWLEARGGRTWALWNAWALVPAGVFFSTILPLPAAYWRLTGFSMFLLNLYLLAWAARRFWRRSLGGNGGVSSDDDRREATSWPPMRAVPPTDLTPGGDRAYLQNQALPGMIGLYLPDYEEIA